MQISYGTVKMHYTATAYNLAGNAINHGHCYIDSDSMQRAEEWAATLFANYNGVGSVHVYGRELEFVGTGWDTLRSGSSDSKVIKRSTPVAPTAAELATYCYETTVLDYFEKVHPRRADGSCQCGHHASAYARSI